MNDPYVEESRKELASAIGNTVILFSVETFDKKAPLKNGEGFDDLEYLKNWIKDLGERLCQKSSGSKEP
jgi:hypothetical protein